MRRRLETFAQIAALMIVLSLGLPVPSEAEVFWTDDFENHLTPNWDTSACGTPAPQDGCNAVISTDLSRGGTHSLKSHYDSNCGMIGTSLGCGSYYDRLHNPTSEMWMRFYYYTINFLYFPGAATKHFYTLSSAGTQTGSELVWVNYFGSREISISAITHTLRTCPNGSTDVDCVFPPNMASVPLQDNRWYCIEFHAKANTGGLNNGVLEVFIDGVQTIRYTNAFLQSDTTQWDLIRHYTQYGQGERYIDDLAVGNTRIGCTGGVAPPPNAPSGLKTQ